MSMTIARMLDILLGIVVAAIVAELGRAWPASPDQRRITRTMQLDNGQVVHVVEPARNCYRLFDHLAAGDTIEVTAPWSVKHRVVRIWCGEYRPEEI